MSSTQYSCIGIDLGTSTTASAVMKNGRCEILRTQGASINMDSIVTYSTSGKIVGHPPRNLAKTAKSTIYEIKRVIGRKFKDIREEIEINKWPFTVIEGENGSTAVELEISDKGKVIKQVITPEQVDADILTPIRDLAERFLNVQPIDLCIITCPVEFSTEQRRATLSAGYLAGFPNIQLVAEPTAAAIAFAEKFDKEVSSPRYYLVYDFGGGTFDASVVYRDGNAYRVVNTAGDPYLGGKNVDVKLMEYVQECIADRHLQVKKRRLGDFKAACREAKELLINTAIHCIDLDFCEAMKGYEDEVDDDNISINITQRQLAQLCSPIIRKTIDVVRSVLATCDPPLTPDEIDKVFLMGGSTNLTAVKDELTKLFRPEQLVDDPTELAKGGIAIGAVRIASSLELQNPSNFVPSSCSQAATPATPATPTALTSSIATNQLQYLTSSLASSICSTCTSKSSELSFRDVSSHEIRLVCGGTSHVILPQKTPIGEPRSLRVFPKDLQKTSARFVFTAGLTDVLEDNIHLGTIRIPLNPSLLPEEQPFLVTVSVKSNDLVDVMVVNELVGKGYHIVLNAGLTETMCKDLKMARLAKEQIDREQKQIQDLKVMIIGICDDCVNGLPKEREEERAQVRNYMHRVNNESLSVDQLKAILNSVSSISHYTYICLFLLPTTDMNDISGQLGQKLLEVREVAISND